MGNEPSNQNPADGPVCEDNRIYALQQENERLKVEVETLHATMHGMQDGAIVRDQMALIERLGTEFQQAREEIAALNQTLREHNEASSIFQPGGKFYDQAKLPL
ncbi:MAG TPA: hypothetical protein VE977_13885, partial [Pyrinomonadaceae bacterium]|nr:hypothetical protein [Pyrinomonadaceae bacterium]